MLHPIVAEAETGLRLAFGKATPKLMVKAVHSRLEIERASMPTVLAVCDSLNEWHSAAFPATPNVRDVEGENFEKKVEALANTLYTNTLIKELQDENV